MSDISIGKLRGGFCVQWNVEGKRRRYQLKASTRKEAEAEAIDVYRAKTHKPSGQSIADIWETYRQDLGLKPMAKTMSYTGKAVLAHFGALRPDQITRDHCTSYDTNRRMQGKSQGTVHTELGHLRNALKFAAKVNIIDKAPYIWRPSQPVKDMRILTMPEMAELVAGADAPHIRLAIILLFGTAARVGAILDLTWDRVDFERGTINLRLEDSITRKGRAIVPMNNMTRAALTAAYEARLSDYVVEYKMGPIKSIRTGFVAALKRSGIGKMRIHDCRHSAAVTMLGAGVPIEQIAAIMGHTNTATTSRIYARYRPEHLQDAANVLNFMSIKEVG